MITFYYKKKRKKILIKDKTVILNFQNCSTIAKNKRQESGLLCSNKKKKKTKEKFRIVIQY